MMKSLIDYLKKDPVGDFEQGEALNQDNTKRNWLIVAIVATTAGALYLLGDAYMTQPTPTSTDIAPIDFGSVIDSDFTEKDNQSALTAQQNLLDKQQRTIDKLVKSLESIEKNSADTNAQLKRNFDNFQQNMKAQMEEQLAAQASMQAPVQPQPTNMQPQINGVNAPQDNGQYLGQYALPPRPSVGTTRYEGDNYQGGSIPPPVTQNGIDSFSLNWDTPSANLPKKRTPDNYVPAGSFVTAVITGGADANAGVNGQGDTAPMVFQTLNNGVLPNGTPSKLNNCTILGAVYGEVSSSRGIVRTQRLSCIFDDEIIDIPVEGTVFNFGRNGIRGTSIMRNGKIVQMAGVSGLLTGIGETGKALSETTSTSALGSTTTISGSDALLNLAGSATASVGSKLADYYIKLAEQYHPIIELNPGNTVNIVFLKGFPLDPVGIQEYEEALANQEQAPLSSTAQILNTISNPLMENLPANIAPQGTAQSNQPLGTPPYNTERNRQYNQQGQQAPTNNAFGRIQ